MAISMENISQPTISNKHKRHIKRWRLLREYDCPCNGVRGISFDDFFSYLLGEIKDTTWKQIHLTLNEKSHCSWQFDINIRNKADSVPRS
ncbi:hypothetical protein THRCLA_22931 [Thraustotheca clavata]|uniref:Uncharacterized protein n=1 Tax=Thraustotheca clavata TaxID=74557 RepID=A0A1V9YNE2_9STRA|nr:hypothetical protein THRCLA_22931 [Thraustotheca clavata]